MKNNNFLGLSEKATEILAVALFIFIGCLGIRVIRSPELALKVANTQLVTSNSANRLEQLARRLEEQAKIIEQKDLAYQELQQAYEDYKSRRKGNVELERKIEAVKSLPEVENIEEIQVELQETEKELLEVTEE
ncbi:MAG: hypothetical protein QNJ72_26215 [Pleurocapsa sp. MO_226.B13]|nr:hypothetical protein [Pleurocapsa sp. MO_226.B13]